MLRKKLRSTLCATSERSQCSGIEVYYQCQGVWHASGVWNPGFPPSILALAFWSFFLRYLRLWEIWLWCTDWVWRALDFKRWFSVHQNSWCKHVFQDLIWSFALFSLKICMHILINKAVLNTKIWGGQWRTSLSGQCTLFFREWHAWFLADKFDGSDLVDGRGAY